GLAAEAAAVGLRTRRTHWGPINRHEAEIRGEAEELLQQVQMAVDAAPVQVPVPGPVPVPGGTIPITPRPRPHDPFAEMFKRVKELENRMSGTARPGPSAAPRPRAPLLPPSPPRD